MVRRLKTSNLTLNMNILQKPINSSQLPIKQLNATDGARVMGWHYLRTRPSRKAQLAFDFKKLTVSLLRTSVSESVLFDWLFILISIRAMIPYPSLLPFVWRYTKIVVRNVDERRHRSNLAVKVDLISGLSLNHPPEVLPDELWWHKKGLLQYYYASLSQSYNCGISHSSNSFFIMRFFSLCCSRIIWLRRLDLAMSRNANTPEY